MTRALLILMPPLLLAGCGTPAQQTLPDDADMTNNAVESNMANSAMMTPPNAATDAGTDSAAYLAKAGAGDQFEIDSSKAIIAKTKNAPIKAFAQMMVDQHGQSTAKLKAAAQAAKLPVGLPKLDVAQQTMLNEIEAASGTAADQAYLAAQRAAHDEALALHRAYAANGATAQLRTAASEIVPVVEHHMEELSKLKTQ